MKVSLAIAPDGAGPASFVVFRERLDVGIAKAAALGYDGVELALGSAREVDADAVESLLRRHHMGISALSTGRVAAERELFLTSPSQEVRAAAIGALAGMVVLAARLGAPQVNCGRIRGPVGGHQAFEEADRYFVEGVRSVAAIAEPLGVDILIEPVNRYELNYINSLDPDGIRLVDRIDRPNVKLMPDLFHMNIEDASIAASLIAAGSRVGYVHIADSNRLAPGSGHLAFEAIFAVLDRIGFDGWLAVEILPLPSGDAAAALAIDRIRAFLPKRSKPRPVR